jgi:sterol 3beta-glucosyltransferase
MSSAMDFASVNEFGDDEGSSNNTPVQFPSLSSTTTSGTMSPTSGDEVDIANPDEDQAPDNFFMNLVTTASMLGGIGRKFKSDDSLDDDDDDDTDTESDDFGQLNQPQYVDLKSLSAINRLSNRLPPPQTVAGTKDDDRPAPPRPHKIPGQFEINDTTAAETMAPSVSTASTITPTKPSTKTTSTTATTTNAATSSSMSTSTSTSTSTSKPASTVAPSSTSTTRPKDSDNSTASTSSSQSTYVMEAVSTPQPTPIGHDSVSKLKQEDYFGDGKFYDTTEDIASFYDNDSHIFEDGRSTLSDYDSIDVSTLQESTISKNFVDSDDRSFDDMADKSPLQKSALKHLNNFVFDNGVLSTTAVSKHNDSHISELEKLKLYLVEKLQKVFDLKDDDVFQTSISSWLVKDVLLQGHLYLTSDSLMYFAFLPKQNSTIINDSYTKIDDSIQVIQQGNLGMKSTNYGDSMFKSVSTHRYWTVLRLETLSIYSSAKELYFPRVIVDLRTCIKAEIIDREKVNNIQSPRSAASPRRDSNDGFTSPRLRRRASSSADFSDDEEIDMPGGMDQTLASTEDNPEQLQDGVWFKLVSEKKTYRFYADNYYTARHWCNNLTKLIFKHNNTNAMQEVLVKIPIRNITKIKKKRIFSGNDDPATVGGPEDESLNGLYIEYVSQKDNSSSDKTKTNATKISEKDENELPLESICLLFFSESDKFLHTLAQTIEFQKVIMKKELESNKPHSKSEKFRSKFKKDVPYNRYATTISTLLPLSASNNIFDQILVANDQSEFPNMILPDFISPKPSSTLRKLGRSLTNPSKILMGRKDSSSTVNSNVSDKNKSDESEQERLENLPEDLVFPRPLSVHGLKALKMSFETSKKDPRIAQSLYLNDISSEESEKSSMELAPALGTEPELQKSSSTLKSIGKNVNLFSGLTKLFTSNPSHFYLQLAQDPYYVFDEEERSDSLKNYIRHFSLSPNAKLIASYYVCLQRPVLPVYGKLYIGEEELCFRSLLPGVSTKMVLPLTRVETFVKARSIKMAYYGLSIKLAGADELFLEFGAQIGRDDCEQVGLHQLQQLHDDETWAPEPHNWGSNYGQQLINSRQRIVHGDHTEEKAEINVEKQMAIEGIQAARVQLFEDKFHSASGMDVPIMIEDSPFFKIEIKPSTSYHFVLLTIGSRGDVQPYIALGKELMKEGHRVTIATHSEFEEWIRKHGLGFKFVAGNPAELMSLMVTHGSMSVSFLKEASSSFKGWIVELLHTSWEACQGADILIESPSAMGGIHIAEALGIPYMRAFTMPWTRTKAYPHAFVVPDQNRGSSYNYLTHLMFERVFWKGISSQVNKWRVEKLDLPKTNLFRMQQFKVPFIYNVSPSILPPAVDFPDWISVSGYWFLEEGNAKDYKPPQGLVDFLEKSNTDKKRIVYIGFGSIVVKDAKAMTKAIVDAVLDSGVRCVLNKGWSDKLSKNDDKPEVELPPEIYDAGAIPHDWLFQRVDAAVHHGGSGTTGASLKAGLPTIVKPFFGDQFFYAMRIEDIGAGISIKKLNSKSLSKAIKTVTTDLKMIERTKKLSENIKKDHGVLRAVEQIYSNLEYARNLIDAKQIYNEHYKKHNPDYKSNHDIDGANDDVDDVIGEGDYFSIPRSTSTPRTTTSTVVSSTTAISTTT